MFDTELTSTTMFHNCYQARVGEHLWVIDIQMMVNSELVGPKTEPYGTLHVRITGPEMSFDVKNVCKQPVWYN